MWVFEVKQFWNRLNNLTKKNKNNIVGLWVTLLKGSKFQSHKFDYLNNFYVFSQEGKEICVLDNLSYVKYKDLCATINPSTSKISWRSKTIVYNFPPRQDLNCRPTAPKANALTTMLRCSHKWLDYNTNIKKKTFHF